jgi:hypothetical protein
MGKNEQETITSKQLMEGVKAASELISSLKDSRQQMEILTPLFLAGVAGDQMALFEGITKTGDLDLDDSQACLIVALIGLALIKVRVQGTECEQILAEAFDIKQGS